MDLREGFSTQGSVLNLRLALSWLLVALVQ